MHSLASRRVVTASLALTYGVLAGCLSVEPPEGVLVCTTAEDCPDDTWACRDNGAGALRCYHDDESDGGLRDVGMDVRTDTLGMDVPGTDGGMPDGDGGADDAGMSDTRPACVDPLIDCPAATMCTNYQCVSGACALVDRDCDDGASCTLDVCVAASGCNHVPNADVMCTTGFNCQPADVAADPTTGCVMAPECTGAAMCNDGNPCTVDTCDALHCVNTAMTCPDDGDLCTEPSVCVAGTCTAQAPVVCADDANACTGTGVCQAGTGACAYPPITCSPDANLCTTNLHCDMVLGCVEDPVVCAPDGNACTPDMCNPSTGACDLPLITCTPDGNACTLDTCQPASGCSFPFDGTSTSSIAHCGASAAMCVAPCPMRANATSSCTGGTCGYGCNTGFVDLDALASNGCEYACTPSGASDDPDLTATDANCDGADGIVGGGRHIYVSPTGTGDGSRPSTPANLPMAFTIADTSSGSRIIMLLQAGSYVTSTPFTTAIEGLEMWGGYAANYRSRTGTTTVTSSASSALFIRGVSSTTIVGVSFTTTNRTLGGDSAHTIDVVDSTVRLIALTITAGNGAPGVNGSMGTAGTMGGAATSGGPASGGTPGAPGGSGVGAGGRGGVPNAAGLAGTAGGSGSCGLLGTGGPGEGICMVGSATAATGGTGGGAGCEGGPGTQGTAASGDGSVGPMAGGLTWIGATGGTGGVGVTGGRGGGGGGGGGIGCPGVGAAGGGGGQGGTGGSGGRGGSGGSAGGASIGVLAMNSTVTFDSVTVVTGSGGTGGRGGDGGGQGAGGTGAGGGSGATISVSGTVGVGGPGGRGGDGGRGGRGGCGGGGVGGVVAGAFGDSASRFLESGTGITATLGTPGAAGPACAIGGGLPGDGGRAYRFFP